MNTIIKWPGGKEKELPVIRKYTPQYNGRFVDPFVGGGSVFFDTSSSDCHINDKSDELINLYKCAKESDEDLEAFIYKLYSEFKSLGKFVENNKVCVLALYHSKTSVNEFLKKHEDYFYGLSDNSDIFINELKKNLAGKIKRSEKLEKEQGEIPDSDRLNNMESALKSAYYMYVRYMHNHPDNLSRGQKAAVFFFIREYCYSSMFRYNAKGEFNVPYGGISYNRKDFEKKINTLLSCEMKEKLRSTKISCTDFEIFLDSLDLTSDDFIFLDPPYDSDFSTYSKNTFGKQEQIRLCDYMKRTKAKALLVIKNTDFIYDLYKDSFNITSFDKKYLVSFMNRNDKKAEHLVITNYVI